MLHLDLFWMMLGEILIEPFAFEYNDADWWWVSLGTFEINGDSRSLMHIGAEDKIWRFQWLWSSDDCHVVERTSFRGKERA